MAEAHTHDVVTEAHTHDVMMAGLDPAIPFTEQMRGSSSHNAWGGLAPRPEFENQKCLGTRIMRPGPQNRQSTGCLMAPDLGLEPCNFVLQF
jgi:hypothetical protein